METVIAVENKRPHYSFPEIEVEMGLLENNLRETMQGGTNIYLQEISNYLLLAPGKRIRPMLLFLSGMAAHGYSQSKDLIPLGTAVELLHMATLIHDDIIDKAQMRRGLKSVNKKYGEQVAVLMGDFCYGKSLELVAGYGAEFTLIMAEVINNLVEGELIQYESVNEPYTALNNYWDRINKKTAFFFSACCRMGAMAAGAPPSVVEILGQYGECLGMAFQVKDDLLDFTGDSSTLGKAVGTDLKNGILTLPVIHAINFSRSSNLIQEILQGGDASLMDYNLVSEALRETGAIEYTRDAFSQYINLARQSLDMLPESQARQALESITMMITKDI